MIDLKTDENFCQECGTFEKFHDRTKQGCYIKEPYRNDPNQEEYGDV